MPVHFIDWKKIDAADYREVMRTMRTWGVRDLVAHPVWRGRTGDVYPLVREAGLRTPACHGLWGENFDLGRADVDAHRRFLAELAPMGVKTCTLHLATTAGGWDAAQRDIDALLPDAERHGMILAVENHKESFAELERLVALVRRRGHPGLGLCFDTGHAHCYSERGLFPALELMREQVVTCHMHDNFGAGDDHGAPGEGTIDWPRLVATLKTCPRLVHAETEAGSRSRETWDVFRAVWGEDHEA